MSIILGIDPGSRITGYGVIKKTGSKISYIASGCIISKESALSKRLHRIYKDLTKLVTCYNISEAAIEGLFVYKNPNSAIKLSHARGAAIIGICEIGINIYEYAPRLVKKNVVGFGNAKKVEVRDMVMKLLNITGELKYDSADALAIAICHANINSIKNFSSII